MRIISLVLLVLVIVACSTKQENPSPQQASPSLILRAQQSVSVGSEIVVTVAVENMEPIQGAQFSVRHDPSVLRFTGAAEGDFFKRDGAQTLFIDTVAATQPGLIKDLAVARLKGTSKGTGIIATLSFTAINPGTTALALESVMLAHNQSVNVDAMFQGLTIQVE